MNDKTHSILIGVVPRGSRKIELTNRIDLDFHIWDNVSHNESRPLKPYDSHRGYHLFKTSSAAVSVFSEVAQSSRTGRSRSGQLMYDLMLFS